MKYFKNYLWDEKTQKILWSRWFTPLFNILMAVLCIGWGITREPGWFRDYFMVFGGAQLGFALIWFITPMRIMHLSKEQEKAMSDDLALVMIRAAHRAEEATGIHFETERADDPLDTFMKSRSKKMN